MQLLHVLQRRKPKMIQRKETQDKIRQSFIPQTVNMMNYIYNF